MRSQAVALWMVASKSLARRRLRPSQREGALDDPASWQQLEAFDARRPFDDLDRPGAAIGHGLLQLCAAIDPVGEDMGQRGKGLPQGAQQG